MCDITITADNIAPVDLEQLLQHCTTKLTCSIDWTTPLDDLVDRQRDASYAWERLSDATTVGMVVVRHGEAQAIHSSATISLRALLEIMHAQSRKCRSCPQRYIGMSDATSYRYRSLYQQPRHTADRSSKQTAIDDETMTALLHKISGVNDRFDSIVLPVTTDFTLEVRRPLTYGQAIRGIIAQLVITTTLSALGFHVLFCITSPRYIRKIPHIWNEKRLPTI